MEKFEESEEKIKEKNPEIIGESNRVEELKKRIEELESISGIKRSAEDNVELQGLKKELEREREENVTENDNSDLNKLTPIEKLELPKTMEESLKEEPTKKGFWGSIFGKKNKEGENKKELTEEEKLIEKKRLVYIEAYNEWRKATEEKETKKIDDNNDTNIEKNKDALKKNAEETEKDKKSEKIEEKSEKEIKKEEADRIYKEYQDTIKTISKNKYEAKKKELEEKGIDEKKKEEELKEFLINEIFEKYVLGEEDILNKAKVEGWPPKERSIFRKGLDKWNRIPKPTRWAISASIGTGLAVTLGTIGVGGAVAFAGIRFTRSMASGLSALGTDLVTTKIFKAWDNITKRDERYSKKAGERIEDVDNFIDNFLKVEEGEIKNIKEVYEKKAKIEKKRNISKLIASIGVGALVGIEGSSVMNKFDRVFNVGGGGSVDDLSKQNIAKEFYKNDPSEKMINDFGKVVKERAIEEQARIQEQIEQARLIAEQKENIMNLATVGKGEGIETVFIRQLEADPTKWGFKGNVDNLAEVHKWAGVEAHKIAIDNGYVNTKTGFETRVLDVGPKGVEGNPAYILEHNASGKISVQEYLDNKPTSGEHLDSPYEYKYKPLDYETTKPSHTDISNTVTKQSGAGASNITTELSHADVSNPLTEAMEYVQDKEPVFRDISKTIDSNFDNMKHIDISDQDAFFKNNSILKSNLDKYEQELIKIKNSGVDVSDKFDFVENLRDKINDLEEFNNEFKEAYKNIITDDADLSMSDYTKYILGGTSGEDMKVITIIKGLNGTLEPKLKKLGELVLDNIDPFNANEEYTMSVDEFIQKVAQTQVE